MREERRPGTTRYRRSTCGCGAFGHKHDEQAFQPKWWNSSPTSVAATLPIILEYDDDFGSTSTTAMWSGDFSVGIEGRDIGERFGRGLRRLARRGIKTRIRRPGGHVILSSRDWLTSPWPGLGSIAQACCG